MTRRAKYLLFQFEHGTLIIHLGMSGRLRVLPTSQSHEKHDHVDLIFTNSKMLRYHDPRRFGSMHWQPENTVHWTLQNLGLEPLVDEFNGYYLFKLTRKRNARVKSLIMNSQIVVGVGNIYANEALFLAGVRPQRRCAKLTRAESVRLVTSIKNVLKDAIEAGGTTLRDYFGVDGETGYFKMALNVYGRNGEACLRCTTPLKTDKHSQRQSIYCPQCQR